MLEAHRLAVGFGDQEIVSPFDIGIDNSNRVVLLGPSGSGKTTILRTLAGLMPSVAGKVVIDGVAVTSRDQPDVWPKLSMVFQQNRLFPHLTARANCTLGLENSDQKDAMGDLARELGIEECLDRRPGQLSQGQAQRVSTLRVLLRRPKYLLLDEPTSALDHESARQLASVLDREVEQRGMALVIATHDLVFAESVADTAFAIGDGDLRELARIPTMESAGNVAHS